MKKFFLCIGLAGLAAWPAAAQQVTPRVYTLVSSGSVKTNVSVSGSATNLYHTMAYTHDVAVFTTITSTNDVGITATVTNYFDLLLNTATTTTTKPLSTVATCNGTNKVVAVTVIPKSSFDGCYGIQCTTVGTGATNYVQVTTQLGVVP